MRRGPNQPLAQEVVGRNLDIPLPPFFHRLSAMFLQYVVVLAADEGSCKYGMRERVVINVR